MTPTREQLELAAKAAGKPIQGFYEEINESGVLTKRAVDIGEVACILWEPTISKSDSFDLMIACGIRPYWTNSEFFDGGDYCAATTRHLESGIVRYKDHNNDKGLTTMWAVFLCAVEIGKRLANGRAM